ncbi:hypothetical protein VTK73DRAFT_1042 [Phialemonium thermophilum]|uniref:Uncharacterized protein n=1 Tax=Phialemonium thermophilum TaxID=223376 RepID=A0ABR3XBL1_9PEZI
MSVIEELQRKSRNLKSTTFEDSLDELSKSLSSTLSLKDIASFTEGLLGKRAERSDLLVLLACLRRIEDVNTAELTEVEAARGIASVIARSTAPISSLDSSEEEALQGTREEDPYARISAQIREVASPGIQAIGKLLLLSPPPSADVQDDQVLITLAALADSDEDWATEKTATLAESVLDEQLPKHSKARDTFIVDAILKNYLRPLFSKFKPTTITESGRKAEYRDPDLDRERALPHETRQTKPWKYHDLRAIPSLSWAIRNADEALVGQNWPLFIPVLLTLLDDPTTRVRSRGLALSTSFLAKIPGRTLRDTGLTTVFEEAIFPTLSFLPNLTPEEESVQLLKPAFSALCVLARKMSSPESGVPSRAGNGLRDRILREGIFTAYFHAREHVRIVEILMHHTAAVIGDLKIHAVKHLKELVPMFSTTITDPFALSHPPSLLAAVAALQATIINCWPRLSQGVWQEEIMKMLIQSWLRLVDDDSPSTTNSEVRIQLRRELNKTAKMLAAVVAAGDDVPLAEKISPLVAKEAQLSGLFSGI